MDNLQERKSIIMRTALIGAIINLILGILKIILGFYGKSHALVADGFHSISDLLTDFLVFIASHFGGGKADREHPYGHGRIETICTIALSLVLALAAFGIIYNSMIFLIEQRQETPNTYVLIMVVFSILSKEWLYRYTNKKAIDTDSTLLKANAWHHRSDAASSIVVFIGILGAVIGFSYLDAIAAIIVGVLIGKMAVSFFWVGVKELVDTAVDETALEKIRSVILRVEDVLSIHNLRTRYMAGKIMVDVHILVAQKITVSEGHFIGQSVSLTLKKEVDDIVDVLVHIDPEEEEEEKTLNVLKSRSKIIHDLYSKWEDLDGFSSIEDVKLHYLSGKVLVEVYFPVTSFRSTEILNTMKKEYSEAVKGLDYVASVDLMYHNK